MTTQHVSLNLTLTLASTLWTLRNWQWIPRQVNIPVSIYSSCKVKILEDFFRTAPYNKSKTPVVHLSDALRVLLVWKFGGIYLDLDYVILNDMTHYQNFLAGNGAGVTNNAFSFTPGHPFLFKVMEQIQKSYDPQCWNCIGPLLFTKCLEEFEVEMKQHEGEGLIVQPLQRYIMSTITNFYLDNTRQRTKYFTKSSVFLLQDNGCPVEDG